MEEEMLKYQIETQEIYLGDILGNINKFGGLIESMEDLESASKLIKFSIPIYGLYNFEKWLKSIPNIQTKVSKL